MLVPLHPPHPAQWDEAKPLFSRSWGACLSLYCSRRSTRVLLPVGGREPQARWHLPVPVLGKAAVRQARPRCSRCTSRFPACPAELSPGGRPGPFPPAPQPPPPVLHHRRSAPAPAVPDPHPAAHLWVLTPAGRSCPCTHRPAPRSPAEEGKEPRGTGLPPACHGTARRGWGFTLEAQ